MASQALLIGINHYYESYRPLKGAIGDAEDIYEWLNMQGVEKIHIIKSPGGEDVYTATPESAQVNKWLNGLDREVESIKRTAGGQVPDFPLGERLYVFFAGHGYDAGTAGPTAVFPQTRPVNWDVFLFGALERHLKSLAYFKEVFVIFDACREVIDYAVDPIWTRKAIAHANSSQVKMILCYPGSTQKTPEKDFGGKIRGVLSQAFLQGVKGLASVDGVVTADRLREYMLNAILAKVPDADPQITIPRSPLTVALANPVLPIIRIIVKPGAACNAVLERSLGGSSLIQLQEGENSFEVEVGVYTLVLPNGSRTEIKALWEVNDVDI